MNKLLSIVFLSATLILCSFDFKEDDGLKERLGVKGPLEFNDTKFNLAWTAHPRENYFVQEYLPAGEKLDSFTQMLTVNVFLTDIGTEDAADIKINELKKRQENDKVCKFALTSSPDKSEYILDFLVSEKKNDELTCVEFDVYRYKQIEVQNNKKALLVYFYSHASYGDSIMPFLKSLVDNRIRYLNKMIETKVPTIQLTKE